MELLHPFVEPRAVQDPDNLCLSKRAPRNCCIDTSTQKWVRHFCHNKHSLAYFCIEGKFHRSNRT